MTRPNRGFYGDGVGEVPVGVGPLGLSGTVMVSDPPPRVCDGSCVLSGEGWSWTVTRLHKGPFKDPLRSYYIRWIRVLVSLLIRFGENSVYYLSVSLSHHYCPTPDCGRPIRRRPGSTGSPEEGCLRLGSRVYPTRRGRKEG